MPEIFMIIREILFDARPFRTIVLRIVLNLGRIAGRGVKNCTIAKLTKRESCTVIGKWARRMWIRLAQDVIQELL
jgi:hypothetical protein